VHIVTTHKGADFDALASLVAANLLYPGIVTVLPGSLNPNVRAFMSKNAITIQPEESPGHAAHLMIKHEESKLPHQNVTQRYLKPRINVTLC
jgi:nanoRNase/pAp phosphatase (c-di-AMP/oligoRNAs hydrolase)